MEFTVTEDQRRALHDDGIVKLPGLVDPALLDELNACFKWSVDHPGPIALGSTEGEDILFMFDHQPIPAAGGRYLKDGDPCRPAVAPNLRAR